MEAKYYLEILLKGLVTSLGLKSIITSKKKKKSRYAIPNVGLKDISKIITEFDKLPYEGYVRKRYKHEPTDSYLYLRRQLSKCMMRLNLRVGPVRTQMTNTQKINISDMNTQNIPNSRVCSLDES